MERCTHLYICPQEQLGRVEGRFTKRRTVNQNRIHKFKVPISAEMRAVFTFL